MFVYVWEYFVVSIIFLLFSFLVFRVVVRRDYKNKLKLSTLSYLLETLVFVIYTNMAYLFLPVNWPGLPPLPENFTLKLLFWIVLSLGLVILLIAWFGLGTGRSFGQDKNKLNTAGIYRFSRNPQLVGFGLIILSFAILIISWYSVGWFLQYFIISCFMIQSEEEFLSAQYGEEYKKYCSNVPRIFKLHLSN